MGDSTRRPSTQKVVNLTTLTTSRALSAYLAGHQVDDCHHSRKASKRGCSRLQATHSIPHTSKCQRAYDAKG